MSYFLVFSKGVEGGVGGRLADSIPTSAAGRGELGLF